MEPLVSSYMTPNGYCTTALSTMEVTPVHANTRPTLHSNDLSLYSQTRSHKDCQRHCESLQGRCELHTHARTYTHTHTHTHTHMRMHVQCEMIIFVTADEGN